MNGLMNQPLKGEIWQLDLDPTVGAEMQKVRPVIVISADGIARLPLKIVVPLTEWDDKYQELFWLIRIDPSESSGSNKLSAVDAFQVRCVSTKRFGKKLGDVSQEVLKKITAAITVFIKLD